MYIGMYSQASSDFSFDDDVYIFIKLIIKFDLMVFCLMILMSHIIIIKEIKTVESKTVFYA